MDRLKHGGVDGPCHDRIEELRHFVRTGEWTDDLRHHIDEGCPGCGLFIDDAFRKSAAAMENAAKYIRQIDEDWHKKTTH
ncbi:hypothetical protein ACFL26_00830 [Patescibacteria group bacterium]